MGSHLSAGYRCAFGEEPGCVDAVAIMTDTDNTGAVTTAVRRYLVYRKMIDSDIADPIILAWLIGYFLVQFPLS